MVCCSLGLEEEQLIIEKNKRKSGFENQRHPRSNFSTQYEYQIKTN
jgi:hypothetical protein